MSSRSLRRVAADQKTQGVRPQAAAQSADIIASCARLAVLKSLAALRPPHRRTPPPYHTHSPPHAARLMAAACGPGSKRDRRRARAAGAGTKITHALSYQGRDVEGRCHGQPAQDEHEGVRCAHTRSHFFCQNFSGHRRVQAVV